MKRYLFVFVQQVSPLNSTNKKLVCSLCALLQSIEIIPKPVTDNVTWMSVYLMTVSVHLVFSQWSCSRCRMLYASVLRLRAFRTWAFLSTNTRLLRQHKCESDFVRTRAEGLCLGVTCRDPLFCLRPRWLQRVAPLSGTFLRSCVSQTGF